ncbi:MAG: phosphoribosylformylglycinamidine cyclo-ligase [Chloroflexi bacterium]|nr:phosphoribosylformylglycinamidine cyclo-ligase [Chloroflexota bacterium]
MTFVKTPLDELTYKINGLAMHVQHELKAGHRERVYQFRLAELIGQAGLNVEMEKRVEVFVNDSLVGYMYLDLWVENMLVVECKALNHDVTNNEKGQVITYLAATGSPVGLLYNFGRNSLEIKRILPPKNVQEWQQHLYRCIWTPPGQTLPPIESVDPAAIRFSVISASPSESVSVRLSASESVDGSSVSVRLSASESVDGPSASVRLSASESVDSSYAASGVNIDAGNRAVELMRDAVKSTYGPEVLAGIGAFGGLFDASALKSMRDPVLVASTDGVGTKVKLAAQAGRYESIGHDIVNHCINDILVQGARPLFFLDYVASSKIDPKMIASVVSGISAACREAGCALLGGETAEMPGVYQPDEFDVAGTIVGIVERSSILPRTDQLRAGDVLVGLRSSGPHTNGYSLIRTVFDGVSLDTVFSELGVTLADALLAPHRSYLNLIHATRNTQHTSIKALAHLTGGGFIENIPRVLPDHLSAHINLGSWPAPPLFQLIQQRGAIATEEMYRVFNMGIGLIVIVASEDVEAVQAAISEETFVVGQLTEGNKRVTLS